MGLVAITGIKSRFVVAGSGVILLALGLLPKLGAIIASIPLPVLGGAGLALFGTVAASGIRALSRVDYEGNSNLVIVAVALGMGVLPIAVPEFYEEFPTWFATIFESGISAAAVTAVLLNLLFNVAGRKVEDEGPIVAEAPPPGVTPDYDHPGGRRPTEPIPPKQEPTRRTRPSPDDRTTLRSGDPAGSQPSRRPVRCRSHRPAQHRGRTPP